MDILRPFAVQLGDEECRHLLGDAPKTLKIRSGQVILKPGQNIGEHSTKDKEEIIVIFEGKAEVSSSGNRSIIAGKDSLVYMPPNTIHNVRNIGTDLLKYIYIVSPIA